MLRPAVRRLLGTLDREAARAYVIGADLSDAVLAGRSLQASGLRTTMCYWSAQADSPRDIADRCLRAIDAIHANGLDAYLSLKAPPLGFSRELVDPIADRAATRGIGLHFDSLSAEEADRTFGLIEASVRPGLDMGCTLPGRWSRSRTDVDRAVRLDLRVRLVKGQWVEPHGRGEDPVTGFLELVDRLAGRARHVAVATHDPVLAAEALARLQAADTPCELELWFGLPIRRPLRAAWSARVPVRLYVPYGHPSLPYAIWQVKTNPHVAWWACRDLYASAKFRVSRSAGVRARYGLIRTPDG